MAHDFGASPQIWDFHRNRLFQHRLYYRQSLRRPKKIGGIKQKNAVPLPKLIPFRFFFSVF